MNKTHFLVVCLSDEQHPILIKGKVYKAENDEKGQEAGMIRVHSETEDLLFPENMFVTIPLPKDNPFIRKIETEITG